MPLNVGFIGTRFSGLDGVSLESAKWAEVLWDFRHISHWFAGELDRDPGFSMLVPEAFFNHPDNLEINNNIFNKTTRPREITDKIQVMKNYLKDKIYEFIDKFYINLIIAQNCLAIPMHIPLGLALTEVIAETGIPTIAHHHDFTWERTRFLVNGINDYIEMAFPPTLPSIRHVVINSLAQKELAARKGVSSFLIPNVINFNDNKPWFDDFNKNLREELGFTKDDILILQPTRIVMRKGIEHAITLVKKLNLPNAKLVISHSSGDEGMEYYHWLIELAKNEGVEVYFISNRLHDKRKYDENGNKLFSLWDLYPHADLITYPSSYEGFGNAFIEAIYFKKPIVVNRYSIYVTDIEPKGFEVITMNNYVSDETIEKVKEVIFNKELREKMVNKNFELGKKFFSYEVLRKKFQSILTSFYGIL